MSAKAAQLSRLQAEIPHLWRGRGQTTTQPGLPSGHAALDALLPAGGWPIGALTELLLERPGLGELSLLLPAMRHCSQTGRRIGLIAPPLLPNGPVLAARGIDLQQLLLIRCQSLADRRWAAEQCLRSGLFGCLLLWPGRCADHELRRLQLAAEHSQAISVLYRDCDCRYSASPAQLRILLQGDDTAGIQLLLLKARGLSCSSSSPLRLRWNPDYSHPCAHPQPVDPPARPEPADHAEGAVRPGAVNPAEDPVRPEPVEGPSARRVDQPTPRAADAA